MSDYFSFVNTSKRAACAKAEIPANVCCDEHRRQLAKFAELAQVLPNVDLESLALHFARHCQNNKKAQRIARRCTAYARNSKFPDDSNSPFYIIDHLLTTPTGVYEYVPMPRPHYEMCKKADLIASLESYSRALKLDTYTVLPYTFDVQLKYRSLSFRTKQQILDRLTSMTHISIKETKLNRTHKDSVMHLQSIVDPFVTPRCIHFGASDPSTQDGCIRVAIYNWHTMLIDQSVEQIRNRFKCNRRFMVGNPFVKVAADKMGILRIDNPKLEVWCTDYEEEIENMAEDRLRDLGNKSFDNDEIYGAIEYYSLALKKGPNDTRILSNRCERYLQSQFPQLALADCEKIFEIYNNNPTDKNIDPNLTWKTNYRKIRALVGLQLYDQARSFINSLLEGSREVSSTNNEIFERFRRILEIDIPRLENEGNGNYDIFNLLTSQTRRPDDFCAEFERNNVFEFRECENPENGFGMFALCPLEPGTLLLVEKPFVYVPPKSDEILIDDPSHIVKFALTQKAEFHLNRDDGGVNSGKYLQQSTIELFQNLETRILANHKNFIDKLGHLTPLRQRFARIDPTSEDYYQLPYKTFLEFFERNAISDGIWPKLSRFNHSCLPNCFYIIIHNLCFVSVIKPINTGEEMTICYLPNIYNNYIDRSIHLRDYHITQCSCKLCDYDRTVGQAELQNICRNLEECLDDENKRRYLFKYLIRRHGSTRPLGFIDEMSQLKRFVTPDIFAAQVQHGYLVHPYILKYILSHKNKYDKIKDIVDKLKNELAYFNWTNGAGDQTQRLFHIIELLMNIL